MEDYSNQIIINCECGTHLLKVQSEVEFSGEGNQYFHQDFYLAMFNFGSFRPRWRDRIRLAWWVLTLGDPYSDQIVLTPDEAKKLAKFIDDNIYRGLSNL